MSLQKINQNTYKDRKRCWDQTKKNKTKHNKIATAKSSLSITTLNINRLNSLIKSEWLEGLKKKKIPTRCCLKEAQLRFEDTHALKVKARQKISMLVTGRSSHTYIRQNNFKSKTVARDTEGHYIMIKQSIHQEDVTIIYRFKDRALKYKANTDRSEGRNTHLYNNNRSYHLTFNNGHNPNRRSRRKQKT